MTNYGQAITINGAPHSETRYQRQRLRNAGFPNERSGFSTHITVRDGNNHLRGSIATVLHEGVEYMPDAEVTAIVHQSRR